MNTVYICCGSIAYSMILSHSSSPSLPPWPKMTSCFITDTITCRWILISWSAGSPDSTPTAEVSSIQGDSLEARADQEKVLKGPTSWCLSHTHTHTQLNQKSHYVHLLQEILVSRQQLLQSALFDGSLDKLPLPTVTPATGDHELLPGDGTLSIERKANKKYRK